MSTIYTAMKPEQVRQGDVLVTPAIQAIDEADVGPLIKEGDGSRIVLAHGEVTGHAHAFYPEQDIAEAIAKPVENPVCLYQLRNAGNYADFDTSIPGIEAIIQDSRLLRLRSRALLRHEEHEPISLPPGDYVVIQQHEGDEMEELRRVAD